MSELNPIELKQLKLAQKRYEDSGIYFILGTFMGVIAYILYGVYSWLRFGHWTDKREICVAIEQSCITNYTWAGFNSIATWFMNCDLWITILVLAGLTGWYLTYEAGELNKKIRGW